MRIVHMYRDCLSPGGVPHQTRRLLEAQARLGSEILTVSLSSQDSTFHLKQATVSHVQARNALHGIHALRRVLNCFDPEMAHVSGLLIPTHQAWIGVLRRAGVPYIVSPHGLLNPIGMNTRFDTK